jgi:predicted outer membrane repeat protein
MHLTGGQTAPQFVFGGGGAIRSNSSSVTLQVERSLLDGNEAGTDGAEGGAIWSSGPIQIMDSTISNNVASGHGGGVYADNSLEIINCTLSGNRALGKSTLSKGHGGGVYAKRTTSVFNSTIVNNEAIGTPGADGAEGGGIYVENTARLSLESSIVAGNSDTHTYASPDVRVSSGGRANLRANVIGFTGGHVFSLIKEANPNRDANNNLIGGPQGNRIDPHILGLALNNAVIPTHALSSQSPAIDAGSNPRSLVFDQRGQPRIQDGNEDGTATIDAGAYERAEFVRGDLNHDGTINALDIDAMFSQLRLDPNDRNSRFDLTGDGSVDGEDRNELIQNILQTNYGDANLDGVFNSTDLIQIFQRREYEDSIDNNSTWEDGDWNGDGEFGSEDLVIAFKLGKYSNE